MGGVRAHLRRMHGSKVTGLLLTILMAIAGSPGRAAPSRVLLNSDRLPGLVMRMEWRAPREIVVLSMEPATLSSVDPETGLVRVLAEEGEGPFDLDRGINTLSRSGDELRIHQPVRGRSLIVLLDGTIVPVEHHAPVVGMAGSEATPFVLLADIRALQEDADSVRLVWHRSQWGLGRSTAFPLRPAASWQIEGSLERRYLAAYAPRVLVDSDSTCVVLGAEVEPWWRNVDLANGEVRAPLAEPVPGQWIDATLDASDVVHIWSRESGDRVVHHRLSTAGKRLSSRAVGRSVLGITVDPTGTRCVAVLRESRDLVLFDEEESALSPRRR